MVGEAMLTMQNDKTRRPSSLRRRGYCGAGGRYAIHELALTPDELPDDVKTDIRQAPAKSIKVNARPLTVAEWQQLLATRACAWTTSRPPPWRCCNHDGWFPTRGLLGALRFAKNVLTHRDARRRVLWHASHLRQASRPIDRRGHRRAQIGRPMTDLASRADVEELLRRFYGRVFVDDVPPNRSSSYGRRGSSRILR